MTNRQKKLLNQIGKEAVRLDWEEAFDGKAYGNKHLHRVKKIAKFMVNREGGDEFVVLAGAWVHDVILAVEADDDSEKIAKFTGDFLKNFKGLKMDELKRIVDCAAEHESGDSLSLEAKIVHDADVIDKSGMLGVVRHIWKMTNMLKNRLLSGSRDLRELEEHLKMREKKLFTRTAKVLGRELNKDRKLYFKDLDFALSLMGEISEMASNGMISDEIANKLCKDQEHLSLVALKRQLSCKYLK
jgi:uncharacterized protein